MMAYNGHLHISMNYKRPLATAIQVQRLAHMTLDVVGPHKRDEAENRAEQQRRNGSLYMANGR